MGAQIRKGLSSRSRLVQVAMLCGPYDQAESMVSEVSVVGKDACGVYDKAQEEGHYVDL